MTLDANTPQTLWDRTAFNELKATWSPARIAEDKKTLKAMVAMASGSPLLSQELQWAKEHDIVIFIDRSLSSDATSGYYVPGTGVIGIPERVARDTELMVVTLAHEIRHAWQDCQGFIGTPSFNDFAQDCIAQAVLEADAEAYGERARQQYEETQKAWRENRPVENVVQNAGVDLARNFMAWFRTPGDTHYYGASLVRLYDMKADFQRATGRKTHRQGSSEFSVCLERPPSKLDISSPEGLLLLGMSFSGASNYLSNIPRETLRSQVLNPARAETLWDTATPDDKERIAVLPRVSHPGTP
jgi:hypothetical protein